MPVNMDRLNVIIVDDNATMRALVKQILVAFGIKNILECADGSDALQELRHFPADIMICDWMMEPVDGLDLTRLVRTASDSPNPYLPVIMLTGHTERHRVEEARDAGVTEFLAKPISAQSVYSRLLTVINRPRPFLKTDRYAGPDRRRRAADGPTAITGRRADDQGASPNEDGEGLSQDEINKLLEE
jgi:two-component system chemotaxis response regulator CheY